MPYKKKSLQKNRLLIILCISITVLLIVAGGLTALLLYQQNQARRNALIEDAKPRIVVPDEFFTTMEVHPEAVSRVRAVQLTPGVDFYTSSSMGEDAVAAELDKVMQQLADYGMNTVIIDTLYDGKVIFEASSLSSSEVNALKLACASAAKHGMNIGVVFHVTGAYSLPDPETGESRKNETIFNADDRQVMLDTIRELAVGYELESVLLEGYTAERGTESFAAYAAYGAVGSYDDWMTGMVTSTVNELVKASHSLKNSLPVGINVSSVWANAAAMQGGSETTATVQSLTDKHSDTKALAESKAVDFVNVRIATSTEDTAVPFKTVVDWWNGVCKTSGIGFYVSHAAENAGNGELPGWNGTTELARQAAKIKEADGCYGSIFTGFARLVENPDGSTENLMQYYEGAYSQEDLDKDLEITSPSKRVFQTYEDKVQFRMKFDPEQEVTLNGEPVVPTERGGSSVWLDLKVGQNTIQLAHKGKLYTYQIERLVHIFKDYSPQGDLMVAGNSQIEVNVMAYKGSVLSATLNGKTIQLQVGGAGEDNNVDSIYVNYQGIFTMPPATGEEQVLGKIKFYGRYDPYDDGRSSGTITVAKLPDAVDPDEATGQVLSMVTVNDSYAYTYPYLTTPAYPQALLYQLPYGTQDIVENATGEFLNLRSGKTIKASSGTVTDEVFLGNNIVSDFSVGVEGGDTIIRATMLWKAPFSITPSPYPSSSAEVTSSYRFNADTVTVTLDYATTMPEGINGSITDSPLFSAINMERIKNEERGIWQYVITLPLKKAGVYMGCHAYYEGNTLVLRFNNPNYSGSLSGVKIGVDPGHGGKDTGTTAGANVLEKDVNLQLGLKIADALRAQGAEVVLTRSGDETVDLLPRVRTATDSLCDLLIAVHHNSGGSNSTVNGIVTYYNAPFSQPLASAVQNRVGNLYLKNNGIHGPDPTYNFVLTREKQFPSILVEYGFLSNPNDEALAMDENNQWQMANATAQGIVDYFNSMQ